MGISRYNNLAIYVAGINTAALTDDGSYLLAGLANPDQPHSGEGRRLPTLTDTLTGSIPGGHGTIALAEASPDTITRTVGSFITDGYIAGSRVDMTGSTADDDRYSVESVTATVLTLDDGCDLANQTASTSIILNGFAPLRVVVIWGYEFFAEKTGDGRYGIFVGPVLENDGTDGTIAEVIAFELEADGNPTDGTDRFYTGAQWYKYPIALQVVSGALVGESIGFSTSAVYTEIQSDADYTAESGTSVGRQPQAGDLALIVDETGGTGGITVLGKVWYSVF